MRKPGTFLSAHPYEQKFLDNDIAIKQRKNEALWIEHKSFMKKLQISRYLKSTVENMAAVYIQKSYRGYCVRMNIDELIIFYDFKKRLRKHVRDYIISRREDKGQGMILTLGAHRIQYKKWQYNAVCYIQRSFRCFLSRRRVNRTRYEMTIKTRKLAVIRLQCFGRVINAIRKVGITRGVKLIDMQNRGARLLQCVFR